MRGPLVGGGGLDQGGPGVGKAVAEWMTHGESEIDLQSSDIARFYAHQRTRAHVRARAAEGFNKTYGIVHPSEQWESNRNVRLSPFWERERELGAVFFEAAGWERPHWYESNAPLLEEFGERVSGREAGVGRTLVVADHQRRAPRDARAGGDFDLSAFCVFDVLGPGALAALQRVAMRQMDVHRPRRLHPGADARAAASAPTSRSCASARSLPRRHRGAARDGGPKWFSDHLPADGSAQIVDLTSSWCTLGLWGPRARDILAALRRATTSRDEGFPFATCRRSRSGRSPCSPPGSPTSASSAGSSTSRSSRARASGTCSGRPGAARLVPAGIGVYGTTGRLEKCYRAFGFELDGDYDVVEAGMAWGSVKEQDFVGKEAHVRQRESSRRRSSARCTVDEHRSASGVERYMLGHEPISRADGKPLVDARAAARGSRAPARGRRSASTS